MGADHGTDFRFTIAQCTIMATDFFWGGGSPSLPHRNETSYGLIIFSNMSTNPENRYVQNTQH